MKVWQRAVLARATMWKRCCASRGAVASARMRPCVRRKRAQKRYPAAACKRRHAPRQTMGRGRGRMLRLRIHIIKAPARKLKSM